MIKNLESYIFRTSSWSLREMKGEEGRRSPERRGGRRRRGREKKRLHGAGEGELVGEKQSWIEGEGEGE